MFLKPFDVYTMLVLLTVCNLTALAMLLLYRGASTRVDYFLSFALAKPLQAAAWFLLSLRGVWPDSLSVYLGNTLLFFGFAFECAAFLSYSGMPRVVKRLYIAFAGASSLAFALFGGDSAARVAMASAVTFFLFLPAGLVLLARAKASRLARGLGIVYCLFSVSLAIRTYAGLSFGPDYGLFSADAVQTLTFLPLFVLLMSSGTALVLLMKEKDDDALAASNDKYNRLFQLSPQAIMLTDLDSGALVEANAAFGTVTGYPAHHYAGKTTLEIGLYPDPSVREAIVDELRKNGALRDREVPFRRSDGTLRTCILAAETISIQGRIHAIASFSDISGRKELEENLKRLVAEKELVLKEVHHRIKNNMNTIISLLSLQAGMAADEEARSVLEDAGNRMQGMALLYDKLYVAQDYHSLPVRFFMEDLVGRLSEVFPAGAFVQVDADIADVELPPRLLSPIGLIVNELFTNSMKYAFIGKNKGRIGISLEVEDGIASLSYEDDGPGMTPEATERAKAGGGFGLLLLESLAKQIGAVWAKPEPGTSRTVFTFPLV